MRDLHALQRKRLPAQQLVGGRRAWRGCAGSGKRRDVHVAEQHVAGGVNIEPGAPLAQVHAAACSRPRRAAASAAHRSAKYGANRCTGKRSTRNVPFGQQRLHADAALVVDATAGAAARSRVTPPTRALSCRFAGGSARSPCHCRFCTATRRPVTSARTGSPRTAAARSHRRSAPARHRAAGRSAARCQAGPARPARAAAGAAWRAAAGRPSPARSRRPPSVAHQPHRRLHELDAAERRGAGQHVDFHVGERELLQRDRFLRAAAPLPSRTLRSSSARLVDRQLQARRVGRARPVEPGLRGEPAVDAGHQRLRQVRRERRRARRS